MLHASNDSDLEWKVTSASFSSVLHAFKQGMQCGPTPKICTARNSYAAYYCTAKSATASKEGKTEQASVCTLVKGPRTLRYWLAATLSKSRGCPFAIRGMVPICTPKSAWTAKSPNYESIPLVHAGGALLTLFFSTHA
eukprot:1159389-Pelagomonas_calceolata.AAC.3